MVWDLVISMMTEKDFWDMFHKKHNPNYYAKKKTKKKKTTKKKKNFRDNGNKRYPIFKISSGMD